LSSTIPTRSLSADAARALTPKGCRHRPDAAPASDMLAALFRALAGMLLARSCGLLRAGLGPPSSGRGADPPRRQLLRCRPKHPLALFPARRSACRLFGLPPAGSRPCPTFSPSPRGTCRPRPRTPRALPGGMPCSPLPAFLAARPGPAAQPWRRAPAGAVTDPVLRWR